MNLILIYVLSDTSICVFLLNLVPGCLAGGAGWLGCLLPRCSFGCAPSWLFVWGWWGSVVGLVVVASGLGWRCGGFGVGAWLCGLGGARLDFPVPCLNHA